MLIHVSNTGPSVKMYTLREGAINNQSALIQMMVLHGAGDKTLSKPMTSSELTHIYTSRSRWVKKTKAKMSLQWHHNGRDGVSNHQPYDCSLNRLFRRRWKKTSKLRVTGICVGPVNSQHKRPVTRKIQGGCQLGFAHDEVVTWGRFPHYWPNWAYVGIKLFYNDNYILLHITNSVFDMRL